MTPSKLETVEISRLNNDNFFYVPRRCEFTRIIVSLSRNDNQWLTSIGWRSEEKNVALNCDNTADGLAIQIPEKFAKEVMPDDVLNISCQELGFEGQLLWKGEEAPEATPTDNLLPSDTISKRIKITPGKSTGSAVQKKYLIGGISAFAMLAIVGVMLTGGSDVPEENIQIAAKVEVAEDAKNVEDSSFKPNGIKADSELMPQAAKDLAAEVADKERKEKALAVKEAADEKIAIAAAEKVKANNERIAKLELEREQILKSGLEEAKQEKQKIEAQKLEKLEEESVANLPNRNVERSFKPKFLNSVDIMSMQKDLADMGYYTGAIDGNLSENTLSAVAIFQSVFEIPVSKNIDFETLAKIRKEREIYVRDIDGAVPQAIAPAPVLSEESSEPITSQASPMPEQSSERALPEPEPTIIPEVVPVREAVAVLDVDNVVPPKSEPLPGADESLDANNIEPPKLLSRKDLEYPSRPRRKKAFTEAVKVEVSYGLDEEGNPVDVEILSNDYEGIYTEDFNKAAFRLVRSQKFRPASSNGTPVAIDGLTLTINFEK